VFSRDGEWLFGTSDFGALVRRWKRANGKYQEEKPLRMHDQRGGRVAFTPDGQAMVGYHPETGLALWDLTAEAPHGRPVPESMFGPTVLAVSPDGTRLATASDTQLRIWRIGEWELKCEAVGRSNGVLMDQYGTGAVTFLPEGDRLVTCGVDGVLRIWDKVGEKWQEQPNRDGHDSGVAWVGFAAEGTKIVTVGCDLRVQAWPMTGPAPRSRLLGKVVRDLFIPKNLSFSHPMFAVLGGDTLVTGSSHQLLRWDVVQETAQDFSCFSSPRFLFDGLVPPALTADGRLLAIYQQDPGRVNFWDLTAMPPREVLPAVEVGKECGRIQLSPTGDTLAVAESGRPFVTFWDRSGAAPKKGVEVQVEAVGGNERVLKLEFSADGRRLAAEVGMVGPSNRTAVLWDLSGEQPRELASYRRATFHPLSLSPDGTRLATAQAEKVFLRGGRPGEKERTWTFPARVECLAFAHDGHSLAVGCSNGVTYVIRPSWPPADR
jgi:WD40 repeat protein